MTAQLQLDGQEVQKMFRSNNITEHMFVKISAPAGRQDGDYQYCASVTTLRENNAVYTTAPVWASVDVERVVAARPGCRDA